jgi:hypothetical protein
MMNSKIFATVLPLSWLTWRLAGWLAYLLNKEIPSTSIVLILEWKLYTNLMFKRLFMTKLANARDFFFFLARGEENCKRMS